MNVKQLIVIAVVSLSATAAATSAFASEEASKFNDQFNTPATRSEVKAEYAQARANGTAFKDGTVTRVRTPQGPSLANREQIKSEARSVARNGTPVTENYMGS
ncbi:MAG: hypothetical protein JWQ11_4305 [Rhizobacter sp.]|nr:hypothetical protein [Rhizobacter sp.]